MHDYQYNLEVVSVVPAEVLTDTGDERRHKLIFHCTRRDAIIHCTAAPSTFEVRNAPSFELVSISLVAVDRTGGSEHVEASSSDPLLIGGPHRTVGAVWVPLSSVSAVDSAAEASAPASRVFVAWSVTRMNVDSVRKGNLELSPGKTPLLMPDPTVSPLIASPFVLSAMGDCPPPNHFISTQRGVASELESAQADALKAATAATVTTVTTTDTFPVTSGAGAGSSLSCAVVGLCVPPPHGVICSEEVLWPLTACEVEWARGSRLTESTNGPIADEGSALSLLISRLVLGSSVTNPEISAGGQTGRVSIVLDEGQETSQQCIENDRCGASCASSKHAGGLTAPGQNPMHRALAADVESHGAAPSTSALCKPAEQQVLGCQDVVLEQFPFRSVPLTSKGTMATSSPHSPACTPAAESSANTAHAEEGAEDTGASADHVGSLKPDPAHAAADARTTTWVDYYASSTQAIGAVPLQTRLQNLYTVPSPQLLDRLKDQLGPPSLSAASPTAEPAPVTDHGLWYGRNRQINFSQCRGSSGSAQEEIRREQEAKRSGAALLAGMQIDEEDNSVCSSASPMARVRGHYAEVRTESALALLRRQALDKLQRRRIR
ncbi:conserved hypothetical protein [Leishmania infantum JPCM5]|uniref:Uncharacterized protein n=2 Tax=Leishmania infantum TaxID=5671 RepID=A4I811_LEIIN|nr:conserved hypothetical protein [Leishmania infantum JPCM5]CAC9525379.1 hypothetical_protein_-_conserved [Leishmania infantum]CAM70950.1 conserved hypothetical protein [Leishmania infantum JPCM5]SUZ44764.1 hypothetical_protein_-_conserved [Leishmania infantum]|eukprot:XP_001467880.1 conserved hypothetical protein [Leishmania infantum JPCM5]